MTHREYIDLEPLSPWHRVFGKPVWVQDFDGEVRKSRLKRAHDGLIIVRGVYAWYRAFSDGTFHPHSFMQCWWPRV